ncbi:MAG TPA: helix-turn-helix domain-containing protein [Gammaproteobacteria bacterium]
MSKTSGRHTRKTDFKASVETCLRGYFQNLNGEKAADLYKLVIEETESALIEAVLEYAENNQSKAADYLGITRGTLRKKIKQYGLGRS